MKNNYQGWTVPVNNYQLGVIDLSDEQWPWNAAEDAFKYCTPNEVGGPSDSANGSSKIEIQLDKHDVKEPCVENENRNQKHEETVSPTHHENIDVEKRRKMIQKYLFDEFISKRKPAILRASKGFHWLDCHNVTHSISIDSAKEKVGDSSGVHHFLLDLLDMPALNKWSSPEYKSHLSDLGSIDVDVEVRSSSKESFGKGLMERMTFGKFLDRVTTEKEDSLYLTAASNAATNREERGGKAGENYNGKKRKAVDDPSSILPPKQLKRHYSEKQSTKKGQKRNKISKCISQKTDNFLSPLVEALHQNGAQFPLQPFIMGNLVPSSINFWMGRSSSTNVPSQQSSAGSSNSADETKTSPIGMDASYSSSGLHHDYHDNLYILLRGTKRFRLYSPADAEYMYLHGSVSTVHENGLINHCADKENVASESKDDKYCEEATSDGIPMHVFAEYYARCQREQKRQQKKDLTPRKNEVEQRLMQAEKDVDEGIEGAEEKLEQVEKELDEIMDLWMDLGEEEDSVSESDCESEGGGDDVSDENTGNEEHNNHLVDDSSGEKDEAKKITYPRSFSRIPPHLLPTSQPNSLSEDLQKQYPKFQHAKAAFCDLMPGDALYLPASWFHEVSSSSNLITSSNSRKVDAGTHMALNFWFHPPNSLDSFDSPYESGYWKSHWEKIKKNESCSSSCI